MVALNLSICVILYESVEVTKRFHTELIESLEGFSDYEVIYYDNSKSAELCTWFKSQVSASVLYSWDPRNLGFAYANNQAILRARYPRILLLNPDVFGFTQNTWRKVAERDTQQSACFVRLLNPDGSFQDCVGETASLRRALRKRPDYASLRSPQPVGMGIMAFMLTEKSVFARVGLLDSDYSLYAEDMDWCHRARVRGISIVYDPTIVLTHIGGSSAQTRWRRGESVRKKYLAERLFIDKHFRGTQWLLMRLLNVLKRMIRGSRL